MNIECLNPAYDRITIPGVYDKISNKEETVRRILLHKSPYVEDSGSILMDIAKRFYFDNERGISEKSKVFEDIVNLERDIDEKNYFSPSYFEDALMRHPCFLGYLVFGDEIFNYKNFKFPSIRSLSEAVNSFFIGERYFSDQYTWRLNGFKNSIHRNTHGDLFASQTDVSGKSSLEKTLFGDEEIFDISSDVRGVGISAYQDWSNFLVANLKYAEYLGKEKIKEIVNWEDVLKEAGGGVGNNSAEAFGTSFSDYDLKFLMDFPILKEKTKVEQFPLHISSQSQTCTYPYCSDGKLFYLFQHDKGDILMEDISLVYKDMKFSKIMAYSEEDLSHLLIATYKYFARDRSKMYKIMKYFNEFHK